MDGKLTLLCVLFVSVPALGAPQPPDVSPDGSPDFFTETAKEIAEQLRMQLLGLTGNSPSKRDAEGNDQNLIKPEMHFSTLRAEASGSAIPSPTMFVGGFSFMMMPTPEGEQIFSKIMENIPNLGANNAG